MAADSEPVDRLRGLGLLLQALSAVTFTEPLSRLLLYLFDDAGDRTLWKTVPSLALIVLQWMTGWMLVHHRPRARAVAIAWVLVALGVAVWYEYQSKQDEALWMIVLAFSTAAWPVASLIAILRGPRTPFARRRADLGGVVLAFGLSLALIAAMGIIEIVRLSARFGITEGWSILLVTLPIFAAFVQGAFGVLAGAELAGAARAGRSRLTTYLIVALAVTVCIVGLNLVATLISERRSVGIALRIVFAGVLAAYLLALPFVIWRYAANAKPLDVPDSAAAAGGLRWAALFYAVHTLSELPDMWGGHPIDVMVFGLSCVQILLAVVAFGTASRRRAMWSSLIVGAISATFIAFAWIDSGERMFSETMWPMFAVVAAFGSLAWLNRPSVRGERSLASIFE